jgi:hypothetical protein
MSLLYQANDLIEIRELNTVSSPPPKTPRALFEQFHDPRSHLPLFQPLPSPKSPSRWTHASPSQNKSVPRMPVRSSTSAAFVSPKKKTPGKAIASPLRLVNTTTPNRLCSSSLDEIRQASLSWTSDDAKRHCRGMLLKELISLMLLPKTQTQATVCLTDIVRRFPSLLNETENDAIAKNLLVPLSWTDSRAAALNLFKSLTHSSPSTVPAPSLSSRH